MPDTMTLEDLRRMERMIRGRPKPLHEDARIFASLGCIACNLEGVQRIEESTGHIVEYCEAMNDEKDDVFVLDPNDFKVSLRPIHMPVQFGPVQQKPWDYLDKYHSVVMSMPLEVTVPSW